MTVKEIATEMAEQEIARRTGWFRPFCLAVLILLLLNTCVVGGAIVLVIRQVISIPPGLIAALTGGQSPILVQGTTVLEKIQAVSQLTTTRFNYSSLISSERELPQILAALYGDKLVMIAVGHVTAGIDMRQLTKDSVSGTGEVMTIKLPPPQLLDCFLDEQSSYVVSRDTGLFARPAPNLDVEARRYAARQFRDMAMKDEILNQVQANTKTVIQALVSDLGVKQVNVITAAPDPNAPVPDSCR
jgi:hypothetical protein